jgi:phenylacetate-CoA ligase
MIGFLDRCVYRPPAGLYHALRRRVARHAVDDALDRQEREQWLETDALRALVDHRIAGLLRHAGTNVPYYREIFREAGVDPESVVGAHDLEKLPFLTRDTVNRRPSGLMTEGLDPGTLRRNASGGSTGEPVVVYQSAAYQTETAAALRRSDHMCGYRFPQLRLMLWGADRDRAPARRRLADYLIRRTLWVDAFRNDEPGTAAALRRCECLQPEFAVAYVSIATDFAQFTRDTGVGSRWRPRAIQTSAELLTADDRRPIEDTCRTAVFDRYGCREVGNIAHECEAHNGLHVLADINHVEIIADDRPAPAGTPGEIVVTNLVNTAMPLIRYRTGDIGVLNAEACPCGRGLPLMRTVLGRTSDIILGPSGQRFHGEVFSHIFYDLPGVRRFRVEQTTLSGLTVWIEPSPDFSPALLGRIEHEILGTTDPAFTVRFQLCDDLPTTPTGKHRFTVSHLASSK